MWRYRYLFKIIKKDNDCYVEGFDKLIDASRGGLPVDISTLPVPPQSMTSKKYQ